MYGSEGALDMRQKELITIAAAVATRYITFLANHARNAFQAGAP
ncbi:MAG TPA: carboxymuconolactone decarboxylase family protein [Methanotrichaceae archaeon]|nr:carboxymuconolactone decarboxylase family protein [Methanotrichaceae archaeon]